jgi:hypothetical protein
MRPRASSSPLCPSDEVFQAALVGRGPILTQAAYRQALGCGLRQAYLLLCSSDGVNTRRLVRRAQIRQRARSDRRSGMRPGQAHRLVCITVRSTTRRLVRRHSDGECGSQPSSGMRPGKLIASFEHQDGSAGVAGLGSHLTASADHSAKLWDAARASAYLL